MVDSIAPNERLIADMDELRAKQMAAEWSQQLGERGIPHVVFGSVAMLLHGCKDIRPEFQDIDFFLNEDNVQEMKGILEQSGFTKVKHRKYKKDDVTIGFSTPRTHKGIPSPTETHPKISGVCVLSLDGLIVSKILAIESLMKQIVKSGYRRQRQKSVLKQFGDFCVLCRKRDEQNAAFNSSD